jgi:uncharacterized protein YndB with AHSA1/START domain
MTVTTPSDREILITRVFAASQQRMFAAVTTPALIRRWLLGPDGWTMPVCEVDLRVGGSLRYLWRNEEDGREFGLHGTFREIVVPDRIVHVESFDDASMPGNTIVTTTLHAHGDTTTLMLSIEYESRELRDMAAASGMKDGIAASYDRLEANL